MMNHNTEVEGAEELSLHFTVLRAETDYCTCTSSKSKSPDASMMGFSDGLA